MFTVAILGTHTELVWAPLLESELKLGWKDVLAGHARLSKVVQGGWRPYSCPHNLVVVSTLTINATRPLYPRIWPRLNLGLIQVQTCTVSLS